MKRKPNELERGVDVVERVIDRGLSNFLADVLLIVQQSSSVRLTPNTYQKELNRRNSA